MTDAMWAFAIGVLVGVAVVVDIATVRRWWS